MNGRNTLNVILILAVVAVVAGAAWYRSQRASTEAVKPDAAEPVVATTVVEEMPEESVASPPATQPAAIPRLVDLGATECKACKELAPILEALREEYKGRLDVEFIDVWKNPDAKAPYNIRLIPTQILYNADGAEVWRHEGFISRDDLIALFKEKVGVS